jgi:hypothetical protein
MANEGMNQPAAGMIPSFKGQPWILWDTVASTDFRVGASTNALGSNAPAIGNDGSMVFFQERTKAKWPNLTNLDTIGQLSYGFKCYAIAFELLFPQFPPEQGLANDVGVAGVPPTIKLAEAILNYSVVETELGQENQTQWPITAFGNAGALFVNNSIVGGAQNGAPDIRCAMVLPEPIDMGRTQNFNTKIKVAQFLFSLIGIGAADGVGMPLLPYTLGLTGGDTPTTVDLPQPPYGIKCKLIGERVKLTQYGAPNV